MGGIDEAIQVGILVVLSLAVVLAVLLVWRDDHKWMDVAVHLHVRHRH